MKDILDLIRAITAHSNEVQNAHQVVIDGQDRLNFNFRDAEFTIWQYWSDAYESIVWCLQMHAKKGPILFSTSDYDLDGYQNYFSALHRTIEMKINGFDEEITKILSPKKSK